MKTAVKTIKRESVTIDANGKILGRLASTIAMHLQGKLRANYQPHLDMGDMVTVTNINKLKVTGKKMEQKQYHHYSGYPGGLRTKVLKELTLADALHHAVWNMLPKNKIRSNMIKRLTISND